MGKIYFDIVVLAITGILWIILSYYLRGVIKKLKLYTLFPYIFYTITLYTILLREDGQLLIYMSIPFTAVTIVFIYRFINGWRLGDTLIFPQAINILTITTLLVEGG